MLEAKFSLAGLTIGQCEVDIMNRSTVAIFEILEKAWATQNCTLVDMKVQHRPLLVGLVDHDGFKSEIFYLL